MEETPKKEKLNLRQQVLVAAFDCSGGDLTKSFTAEDLLLAAWKRDRAAWGLRGHEIEHPDSERIYVEIDRASMKGKNVRGGLVGLGLFEKVRQRTYRLTTKGLVEASSLVGVETGAAGKAERALADALRAILSHPVFAAWVKDPAMPKYFRDAGHFWGIAPGTPASFIRTRLADVDNTLESADARLKAEGGDRVSERHGKTLYDKADVNRAQEFQAALKARFARDLATLGVIL